MLDVNVSLELVNLVRQEFSKCLEHNLLRYLNAGSSVILLLLLLLLLLKTA